MKKKHTEKISSNKQLGYLILLAIMLAGAIVLMSSQGTINKRISQNAEAARPADLSLTYLTLTDCPECFDSASLIDQHDGVLFNATDRSYVDSTSEEGSKLIAKHEITNLPAVIIEGELDKENVKTWLSENSRPSESAAVWTTMLPIYVNAGTGEKMGIVGVTYITDNSCDGCYDPQIHRNIVTNTFGLVLGEENTVDARIALVIGGLYGVYTLLIQSWQSFTVITITTLLVIVIITFLSQGTTHEDVIKDASRRGLRASIIKKLEDCC